MFATYSVQNSSFIISYLNIFYLNLKFTYLAGVNIVVCVWRRKYLETREILYGTNI